MIVNENITAYIHSLERDRPEWLEKIRTEAEENKVPIIRREMEPFINVLLNINRPEHILEIGTGIGYSALFMNECFKSAEIVTIENYEPRLKEARENFKDKENIRLIEGEAGCVLKQMEEQFGFIFLDAAKAQYITMLPDILRLLKPGGLLLADNILQDGELVRSRYALPRRQRTIHSRLREFVREITRHPELDSSLITIGDGVTLSVKK